MEPNDKAAIAASFPTKNRFNITNTPEIVTEMHARISITRRPAFPD
jgi:hypothetical protein